MEHFKILFPPIHNRVLLLKYHRNRQIPVRNRMKIRNHGIPGMTPIGSRNGTMIGRMILLHMVGKKVMF